MTEATVSQVEIPEVFHELLRSRAVAFVSTIGKRGEPQTTPLWFLWDGERVRVSLPEGRQKLRNLRRDPRISVVIADPARPTFYLELRGRVDELVPDPDLALERAVAEKYAGSWEDVEPPGTVRYATSVLVEKITSQLGH
jgi:PPOX class probable F420-dependent enzyme